MKTFDYQKARSALNEREKIETKRNAELEKKASEDFNVILQVVLKYNPVRIYQWGSLLDSGKFNEISDIDIAVEGIDNVEDFFKMHKEIEQLTDFTVDLVQFENIEPEFRKIIKLKGRLIYDKIDNTIDILISELNETLAVMNRIAKLYFDSKERLTKDKNDSINAMAISEIFVKYYTCMETVFLRISQYFENNLPSDKWHAELLKRMKLEISPFRPRVISEEVFDILDEFRRFRHFQRYYFGFSYDWDRLEFLALKFYKLQPLIEKDLQQFKKFLEKLKD